MSNILVRIQKPVLQGVALLKFCKSVDQMQVFLQGGDFKFFYHRIVKHKINIVIAVSDTLFPYDMAKFIVGGRTRDEWNINLL